jgi:hypothetical protein
MANPTTNYGFVLPTSSDLVTDLPADFDVALQGVDTRLKALQPGTTEGDLAYSSATANTNTRLAIGSTGNVLTVAGGVPTWAAPAGGLTWEAFTPTWGNLTVGNGTVVARKATTNDYETLFIQLTFGSTTSVTGSVYVNTPTTGVIDYSLNTGTCAMSDASTGNLFLGISTNGTDGGVQRVFPNALNSSSTYTTLSAMTSTVPFTWATGDILAINIYYEF